MRLLDDTDLLAAYASGHSEEAFAILVERHVGMVYSSALRQVGNPHLAEEVAQAVFIILARKAGRFNQKTMLAGWLCRTARFTARNALKAERRRQHWEQEAGMELMESNAEVWPHIAPLLDEAVAQLGDADRSVVVMRYYQRKPLAEVGRLHGWNADTAQKRVSRALEKLRKFFSKRGVVLSAATIAGAVAANSVQAAPAGLTQTISTFALAKGATAGGSTLTLVKGGLKVMAWTKIKAAMIVGAGLVLAAGATAWTVDYVRVPGYHPDDLWTTSYGTGLTDHSHPAQTTFPPTPVLRCSISGLLGQSMTLSGWRYEMHRSIGAGTVEFGHAEPINGEQWIAAFENALETNHPQWWNQETKHMRRDNLVLVRFPEAKTILVLPPEEAAKYR